MSMSSTFDWSSYTGGYGIPSGTMSSHVGGGEAAAAAGGASPFPVGAVVGGAADLAQGLMTKAPRYNYNPMFNIYQRPQGIDTGMADAYKKQLAKKASGIGSGVGTAVGAALTPVLGPLGVMLGGALGKAAGSLIGGAVAQSRIKKEEKEAMKLGQTWDIYHNDMLSRNATFNAEQMYKNQLQQNV